MTKEALEKEAKEWCESKNFTSSNIGYFAADYCEQSYIAGAESREKRIAELEKINGQLAQAKEILRDFLSVAVDYIDKEDNNYSLITEAEQFLKEE